MIVIRGRKLFHIRVRDKFSVLITYARILLTKRLTRIKYLRTVNIRIEFTFYWPFLFRGDSFVDGAIRIGASVKIENEMENVRGNKY